MQKIAHGGRDEDPRSLLRINGCAARILMPYRQPKRWKSAQAFVTLESKLKIMDCAVESVS